MKRVFYRLGMSHVRKFRRLLTWGGLQDSRLTSDKMEGEMGALAHNSLDMRLDAVSAGVLAAIDGVQGSATKHVQMYTVLRHLSALPTLAAEVRTLCDAKTTLNLTSESLQEFAPKVWHLWSYFDRMVALIEPIHRDTSVSPFWRKKLVPYIDELKLLAEQTAYAAQQFSAGKHSIILSRTAMDRLEEMLLTE